LSKWKRQLVLKLLSPLTDLNKPIQTLTEITTQEEYLLVKHKQKIKATSTKKLKTINKIIKQIKSKKPTKSLEDLIKSAVETIDSEDPANTTVINILLKLFIKKYDHDKLLEISQNIKGESRIFHKKLISKMLSNLLQLKKTTFNSADNLYKAINLLPHLLTGSSFEIGIPVDKEKLMNLLETLLISKVILDHEDAVSFKEYLKKIETLNNSNTITDQQTKALITRLHNKFKSISIRIPYVPKKKPVPEVKKPEVEKPVGWIDWGKSWFVGGKE